MSFDALGEAIIGGDDVAYHKEACVPEKISPCSVGRSGQPSKADLEDGDGNHEQKDATWTSGPLSQPFSQALTTLGFEVEEQGQCHQQDDKEKLEEP